MKHIIILVAIIFQTGYAFAEVKYLNDVIQQETQGQNVDLAKVLSEIQLSPATDPDTGNSIFKVVSVVAGSIYEKAGIKSGDLVEMDSAPKSGNQKVGFKKAK